jgi:hypothetical protein
MDAQSTLAKSMHVHQTATSSGFTIQSGVVGFFTSTMVTPYGWASAEAYVSCSGPERRMSLEFASLPMPLTGPYQGVQYWETTWIRAVKSCCRPGASVIPFSLTFPNSRQRKDRQSSSQKSDDALEPWAPGFQIILLKASGA